MNKRSAKIELEELVSPSEKKIHIIIYAYNGYYKSHDMTSKKRHSIDTLSETEAKLLSKDRQYAVMFFQPSGKNVPAWIDKVCSLAIPVNPSQEDLLKKFFDCNFTPKEFASTREYYAWSGMQENEEFLYRGVTDIWGDCLNALAIERGLH